MTAPAPGRQPDPEERDRFFSIKWKLSLAFIFLTLGIVAIYIVIAKGTFESDKVSYIFETQQKQINASALEVRNEVQRLVFDSRSILSGYDFTNHRLAAMSQKLFTAHDLLIGIQLRNPKSGQILAQVEKSQGLFSQTKFPEGRMPASELDLIHLDGLMFAAQVADVAANGEPLVLRMIFQLKGFFSDSYDDQELMLTSGEKVVLSTGAGTIKKEAVAEFLKSRTGDQTEITQIKEVGGVRYLISSASLGLAKMNIFSFIAEDTALRATRLLYQRSLMFLIFSFFATVVISMILSRSLTKNLFALSVVAERIGKGDFTAEPGFRSSDEIGFLARAFRRMSGEIQGLLTERVEKVRMEKELMTARAVQDNLFPSSSTFEAGNLKLAGLYSTTSECGGDWWYYYLRDRFLYVVIADATGHGTPAALLTAAIRSAFSHIELNEMSLSEIADCCDEAVFQCSKSSLYMTALIMRLNVNTGEGTFINASHEPPMIFEWDLETQKIKTEHVISKPASRLGERKKTWTEFPIQVKSGQRLFLYTDGLSSPLNQEGREFQGRKQKRALDEAALHVNQQDFFQSILNSMNEYSQGVPAPDDITFIAIDHFYHVG